MQSPLGFKIHGMDCAEEVAILKREVGPVVGGEDRLGFDILNGKMTVLAPPNEVTPEAIIGAVTRTGLRAEVWGDAARGALNEGAWQRHGRTMTTIASGTLASIGFAVHAVFAGGVSAAIGSEGLGVSHHVPWAAQSSYLLAVLTGLWHVVPKAWLRLRSLARAHRCPSSLATRCLPARSTEMERSSWNPPGRPVTPPWRILSAW